MGHQIAAGLYLGVIILLCSSHAFSGAWTLKQGTSEAAVTGTFSAAGKGFGATRALQSIPRYDKFELRASLEYGLSDQLTVFVASEFQHGEIAAPIDAQRTGPTFFEAGARRLLHQGDWVISGQLTGRLPGTSALSNIASAGSTDAEIDLRGLLGRGFALGDTRGFIDLQFAQRFRLGDEPDEFRTDFTFGWHPASDWLLLAQTFNVWSEGAGDIGAASYAYHKLQVSAQYELSTGWALQVGGFTTFAGRNALQENAVILGTVRKF